ncbi:heterokaryon incompatibility protein-domain-containing protein [Xylaria grammica]|nr:heterokaryon incompatibility protein-domain-containing protein [Xylaria grammica]
MRLLNIHSLAIENVDDVKRATNVSKVPYVIISHRWLENELTFDDIYDNTLGFWERIRDPSWAKAQSAAKLLGACKKAGDFSHSKYGNEKHPDFVHHVWLDTVCINKRDPAELSESINSMYRWYKEAAVCFVYIHDYRKGGKSRFADSSWFRRGWTLQELVAPAARAFYDQDWNSIGDKLSLVDEIVERTGISRTILSHQASTRGVGDAIGDASVGHRMSWYADRQTTKGEDAAYCLMGLFGVNTLYGEGAFRAFRRLQEEILRYSDDHTLFAWVDATATDDGTSKSSPGYGLLAPNPGCFRTSGAYEYREREYSGDGYTSEPYSLTNKGLSISLRMFRKEPDVYMVMVGSRGGYGGLQRP